MLAKKADDGNMKFPRASFFSQRSATSKKRAAEVFQSHAPKTDADGNIQNLKKPKITPSTEKQRDRALLIWGE